MSLEPSPVMESLPAPSGPVPPADRLTIFQLLGLLVTEAMAFAALRMISPDTVFPEENGPLLLLLVSLFGCALFAPFPIAWQHWHGNYATPATTLWLLEGVIAWSWLVLQPFGAEDATVISICAGAMVGVTSPLLLLMLGEIHPRKLGRHGRWTEQMSFLGLALVGVTVVWIVIAIVIEEIPMPRPIGTF